MAEVEILGRPRQRSQNPVWDAGSSTSACLWPVHATSAAGWPAARSHRRLPSVPAACTRGPHCTLALTSAVNSPVDMPASAHSLHALVLGDFVLHGGQIEHLVLLCHMRRPHLAPAHFAPGVHAMHHGGVGLGHLAQGGRCQDYPAGRRLAAGPPHARIWARASCSAHRWTVVC